MTDVVFEVLQTVVVKLKPKVVVCSRISGKSNSITEVLKSKMKTVPSKYHHGHHIQCPKIEV